jgi:O-antigen/teichoic acid export membrane protein
MKTWALVAYRAGSDAAGKAAFFVVTIVAARRLSREAFGVFSLGTTVGWMAAVLSDFGIQLHLARVVARQPEAAAGALRAWLRVRLGSAAAVLALTAAGVVILRPQSDTAAAILLFTAVYVVNALVELFFYFFRGLSRSDVESSVTLAQRASMLLLASAVLWWMPSVTWLGASMLVPALAALGYVASRALALPRARARPPSLDIHAVIPIGAGIVLSALYFRIDVLLIEWWNGAASVAAYNAVFRLVEALRLLPAAVMAVALPQVFRATTREPLTRVAALVTAVGLMISAGLWIAAPRLVPLLYGAAYADAASVFRILLLSFPLMSLNYALTHQVIGWNGHRAYAAACGAALAVNVALNARLLTTMGIAGAAWATVVTELVITGACLTFLAARAPGGAAARPLIDAENPGVAV